MVLELMEKKEWGRNRATGSISRAERVSQKRNQQKSQQPKRNQKAKNRVSSRFTSQIPTPPYPPTNLRLFLSFMFFALLPQYSYSLCQQENGDLPNPFDHLVPVGPYSSVEEAKTSVLPMIVSMLNKTTGGGLREDIDGWLNDHKEFLEREKREVALASAATTPKNNKRQSRPYKPSALTQFILQHVIPDLNAKGKEMLNITTYEDLQLFSDIYQDFIEGVVQFMPLIYSSTGASADAPPLPLQRVHEENDSNSNKRRKTEDSEEDSNVDEDD